MSSLWVLVWSNPRLRVPLPSRFSHLSLQLAVYIPLINTQLLSNSALSITKGPLAYFLSTKHHRRVYHC